jgi:isocitrate/isopropylmalate dehydrogenase
MTKHIVIIPGDAAAARLEHAITQVYADGRALTPDQGGTSTTTAFCAAVQSYLENTR